MSQKCDQYLSQLHIFHSYYCLHLHMRARSLASSRACTSRSTRLASRFCGARGGRRTRRRCRQSTGHQHSIFYPNLHRDNPSIVSLLFLARLKNHAKYRVSPPCLFILYSISHPSLPVVAHTRAPLAGRIRRVHCARGDARTRAAAHDRRRAAGPGQGHVYARLAGIERMALMDG